MLDYAVNEHNAPIAIRYPRGTQEDEIDNGEFVLSKASILKNGSDITIVAEGASCSIALRVAHILREKGIDAEVIDVRTIKPIDFETIFASVQKTGKMFCIEQNVLRGGMGEAISSEAGKRKLNISITLRTAPDEFISHGTDIELREKYGQTIVIVTHDPDLAKMCDRSFYMIDGAFV
jgi:1-deoxy-D-xylulose-5-phosphate synthase